ncbi:hypothetical protein HZC32_02080 [Candidatus Woesearchaeota archaeon]|nr:hypothetical protein [Candidatus Woesearchaeota archaeon]
MQVNIQERKDNPFLRRVEVKGTIGFEGATPSNAKLSEVLAKELKTGDAELVVVKSIYTAFSRQEARFTAVVYHSKDAKKNTEKLTKHMKKKVEEAQRTEGEKKEGEQ